MGYPCPASPEDQVEVAAETKSPFQRPNFLHEDLSISGLMLRARGRTLLFSNLLVNSDRLRFFFQHHEPTVICRGIGFVNI